MSAAQQQQQQQQQPVDVAVRIRPLNQRERDAKSEIIIRTQDGKKAFIKDPETGEEKEFTVDHAFESFDKKEVVGAPLAVPDQKQFFDAVVAPPLKDALAQGRNLVVMTYGATSCGGSYTVLGSGNGGDEQHSGILPRVAKQILDSIAAEEKNNNKKGEATTSSDNNKSTLSLQVVLICHEDVNDLLTPYTEWQKGGLKPKFTKDGYVVDSLAKNIQKTEDLEEALQFTDRNSVFPHGSQPSTNIRCRPDYIYFLNYYTNNKEGGDIISSRIAIGDLAGSERNTSAANCTGQMLKEGLHQGRTFVAIGTCIKGLCEGSKRPLPFRDSKLTLLLQSSMQSAKKIIVIAKVSPASSCFSESLSTLRFVDHLKTAKKTIDSNKLVVEGNKNSNNNNSSSSKTVQQQQQQKAIGAVASAAKKQKVGNSK